MIKAYNTAEEKWIPIFHMKLEVKKIAPSIRAELAAGAGKIHQDWAKAGRCQGPSRHGNADLRQGNRCQVREVIHQNCVHTLASASAAANVPIPPVTVISRHGDHRGFYSHIAAPRFYRKDQAY